MSSKLEIHKVIRQWSGLFFHLTMKDFRAFMAQSGLSHSQINTLMRLHFQGPFIVSDIGDDLGVSSPAASQMIDKLVQQGLVERTEDPANRRTKQIRITAKGDATVEKGIDARQRWMQNLTGTLSRDDQDTVYRALTIMLQAAEKSGVIASPGHDHGGATDRPPHV
jgi:DNA-binding MarR family transcriptional regulator